MTDKTKLGGTFQYPDGGPTIHRIGYGAMQLTGPHVWGPPKDPDAALAVLREAAALGVDHFDTADFYGPHVTNRLIREALAPYAAGTTIVTKIGYGRGDDGSWFPLYDADFLRKSVEENLENLGLDTLAVVNLRMGGPHGPEEGSIAEPLANVMRLRDEGLIGAIGMSNVTIAQVREARAITSIACVQNQYNLAHREDDAMIDELAVDGVAYVPFFPLGGFSPLQSSALSDVATALDATPMQVALAWLLQRSPNILLIPGTSSVEHLRENLKAADLVLDGKSIAALEAIGTEREPA